MKRLLYIFVLFIAIVPMACENFLDVDPKGYTIPKTVTDYERMLLNPMFNANGGLDDIVLLTDESINPSYTVNTASALQNIYCWKEVIDMDINSEPRFWGKLYNRIYTVNVVINEIADATGGSDSQKKQIKAEALFLRAYQYFQLMTLYAPAYDKATANNDLGVPIKTSLNVAEPTPDRATVQQCMDFIIKDLTDAINNSLPEKNTNNYRPNKYAAYALLSRIYLSMRDYPNAEKYADLALQANHELLDYNQRIKFVTNEDGDEEMEDDFPSLSESPQELWVIQPDYAFAGYNVFLSEEVKALYDSTARKTDTRFVYFTERDTVGDYTELFWHYRLMTLYPNFGISFPELYLTKAEAALRNSGDIATALGWIYKIREKRVAPTAPAEFIKPTTTNTEKALQLILDERMRELLLLGHRWTDMRRLDKEGRMKAVIRTDLDGKHMATLQPNDKAYTLQIPVSVQNYNPNMPLNPR